MRFGVYIALAFSIAVGSAALAAQAGYVSQKGTWIRNKAESKIPPDTFAPLDTPVVVTQDDGSVLKFLVYALTPNGIQPGISYEGAYDGKPYPYGQDATRSFMHVSPNSYRTDWKSTDGSSSTETVTFNAGNTKMRFEGKHVDQSGKTVDYVQVWDKLQ